MKIITNVVTVEEIIKKSRFIGIASPCYSEHNAVHFLQKLHAEHPNASHIVFAYRIQTAESLLCRFNDAGEPSGTAGKPIFQHLEGKQLINTIIAVIRYFGGIKLGAGGLTRAYGNTAKSVLEAAGMIDYVEMTELTFSLNYKQVASAEYHIKKCNGEIVRQTFLENVDFVVRLPKKNADDLLNALK